MKIPNIIHQTWKSEKVPPTLAHDFQSWRKHHPDWKFIFWDDDSLLLFVKNEFPQLLDLYESYSKQIDRVNMARYLILKKHGGVFVDLDIECLKPIDPLLAEWTMLVGCEPDSHAEHPAATRRRMPKIIGTACIASVPEHPFWDYALEQLPLYRHHYDPLEATGPIFLTAAIATWKDKNQIAVAPALLLYPFDRAQTWSGETFDIEFWEASTRKAFAVHHWEGSWLERGSKSTRSVAQLKGRLLTDKFTVAPPHLAPNGDALPMISCLMVTRDRVHLAKTAIECFQNQTYRNRELVIVDDSPRDELADLVASLADPRIRHIRLPDEKLTLGALRNISVDRAQGHYIAQWDDDDLCDPFRLEYQYALIRNGKAHACMMSRWMQWWPESRRLAISEVRPQEGSLLCEKSVMPRYPELRMGEDTILMQTLVGNARVVYCDMPRLYLYLVHGNNTWPLEHMERTWGFTTARYLNSDYDRVLSVLARRLPVAKTRWESREILKDSSGASRATHPAARVPLSGPPAVGME